MSNGIPRYDLVGEVSKADKGYWVSHLDHRLKMIDLGASNMLKMQHLNRELAQRDAEITRLRRGLDEIKIQGYERGQTDFHDMALELLQGEQE